MHETAPAESSSSSAVECQYALWQIPGTFAEDHLQLLSSPSCLARLPNCTQPPFATVIPSHQKFAVPNSTSMSGEPERPPSSIARRLTLPASWALFCRSRLWLIVAIKCDVPLPVVAL